MKIAVPLVGELLSTHFGRCEEFALCEVDADAKAIVRKEAFPSPPHEPGLLPQWLHEKGANVIITSGMGPRAQQLFAQLGIEVVLGATGGTAEELVAAYLERTLESGENPCDH